MTLTIKEILSRPSIEPNMPDWLSRPADGRLFEAYQKMASGDQQEDRDTRLLCELVSRYGAFFPPRPDLLDESMMHPSRQAYLNCQRIALGLDGAGKDMSYCDGFMLDWREGLCVRHEWVVDKNGVVSDPTSLLGRHPELVSYLGFAVDAWFVKAKVAHNKSVAGGIEYTPIQWTSLPEGWEIDDIILPSSEFENSIPIPRCSSPVPEYSDWG